MTYSSYLIWGNAGWERWGDFPRVMWQGAVAQVEMESRSVGLQNPDLFYHAVCFLPECQTCSFRLSLSHCPDLHVHHSAPIPADPDPGAGEHLGKRWCAHVCHVSLHVPGPAHAPRPPTCAGKEVASFSQDLDFWSASWFLQIQNLVARRGLDPSSFSSWGGLSAPPLASPAVDGEADVFSWAPQHDSGVS